MTRALLSFAFLLLVWGFVLGYLVAPRVPYCPHEDSCRADYRAGAWHIEEVTP